MDDHKTTITIWLKNNWRQVAFIIYFAICLFDFVIMPGIISLNNKLIDIDAITKIALQFKDPSVQIEIIKSLTTKQVWVPLTMNSSASFHLAWGALLTSVAFSHGREQLQHVKNVAFAATTSGKVDNPD